MKKSEELSRGGLGLLEISIETASELRWAFTIPVSLLVLDHLVTTGKRQEWVQLENRETVLHVRQLAIEKDVKRIGGTKLKHLVRLFFTP
jgi:hypothetical protein